MNFYKSEDKYHVFDDILNEIIKYRNNHAAHNPDAILINTRTSKLILVRGQTRKKVNITLFGIKCYSTLNLNENEFALIT